MSKDIQILDRENIPSSNALIIPGRLTHAEVISLENCFPDRKIIWLCEEKVVLDPLTEQHLSNSSAEAIAFSNSDTNLEEIGQQLLADLGSNGVAIFLPGQANAVKGAYSHIAADTLNSLCKLKLPVTPLAVSAASETRLSTISRESSSTFVFQPTIAAEAINPAKWHQSVMLGNSVAYDTRPFLKESLGYNLLKGLKMHSDIKIFDGTNDQEKTYGVILGIALALAKHIKEQTKKDRVAIILPPGTGGFIANLAVIFAGKTPVNINFTASDQAIKSSIKQADVDRYITADPFVRKVSDFPWPPLRDLIHIERILPKLKKSIKRWVIVSKIFSAKTIAKFAKINLQGGDKEAILLFTSGSSGNPKGVPLTHKNVLSNVCQFASRLDLQENSSILGCLPLFHSFGCTGTFLFPIIEGINLITYPNPLETKRLAELIENQKVEVMLSTPTFLRGFMRRIDPQQMKSIKVVVTGAEKLPKKLSEAFYKKFDLLPQEGYGLTETSPATNFNVLIPKTDTPEPDLETSRLGTVGKFLPGIAIKVVNPASDEEIDIDQSGLILLKGPNIFPGYLNNTEKTDEVFDDGWFKTGDVGRIDHDGFLHIEGRISRFSKIAGEMVPHETLEAAIITALDLDNETERKVAIVGVPDEKKGEATILLSSVTDETTAHQAVIDLRYKLLDVGIPSLWCPKEIRVVDDIPILASGKLDIKGCENLINGIED